MWTDPQERKTVIRGLIRQFDVPFVRSPSPFDCIFKLFICCLFRTLLPFTSEELRLLLDTRALPENHYWCLLCPVLETASILNRNLTFWQKWTPENSPDCGGGGTRVADVTSLNHVLAARLQSCCPAGPSVLSRKQVLAGKPPCFWMSSRLLAIYAFYLQVWAAGGCH